MKPHAYDLAQHLRWPLVRRILRQVILDPAGSQPTLAPSAGMRVARRASMLAGGFTLAEVMIAVGIIAVGFLGSFAMVLQSGKQASAAEESSLVSTTSEQAIDLLRTLNWTALTTGTGITSTVWNASQPSLTGLNVTNQTITISAYGLANAQTLTATKNAAGTITVTLAPVVGGATVALSTATAVTVTSSITWTGRRSGRSMTQKLTTIISQGGISASELP